MFNVLFPFLLTPPHTAPFMYSKNRFLLAHATYPDVLPPTPLRFDLGQFFSF